MLLEDSTFHSCPYEVVQLILEWAAYTTTSLSTLLRISRNGFALVTPIIYYTVKVQKKEKFGSLVAALSSPTRGRVYQSHIRHLFLDRRASHLDLQWCNNLRHISIPHTLSLSTTTVSQPMPALTHLTLHRENLTQILPSPFFQSITHIFASKEILDFFTLTLNLSDTILPNLTHIIAPILTNDVPSNDFVLRRFFTGISRQPSLKFVGLGLFWFNGVEDNPDPSPDLMGLLDSIGAECQAKIFSFPLHKYPSNEWEKWLDDGSEVWRLAEELLQQG
ncbi:hypothetical protein M422DRAFT_68748 [Sphaerobolus stellatus SS14]|uniref:F-box domain-containing protein n=1 Tax=Sphaerobolus stellatus (strain SS14) TaxID=990650 RepID=A0A0C9U9J4_SPHS4|nr:hypothetical protein M422DRAFT_68748 [Sphaerobolus stellatus SS14]